MLLSRTSGGAAGTVFIAVKASNVHLYELDLRQGLDLRQMARLPVPDDEEKEAVFAFATWAPDSSMVLLLRMTSTVVRGPDFIWIA